MVSTCPKCRRNVPEDAVYCPYCGYGLKPSARTTLVSTGGTLTIVAAVAHLIIFVQSVKALAEIYSWYPSIVARSWIVYDQTFAVLSFVGFLSGLLAGILSLGRIGYMWAMVFAVVCALSSIGVLSISMIIPFANVQYSLLYYFLPMSVPSFIALIIIYPRRAEFKK